MKRRSTGGLRAGSLGLGLALLAAATVALGAHGARAQSTADRKPATQRLVLAHYYYDFQGDPRKPLPLRNIRGPKGTSLLTNHPWESVGPWLSYDRPLWHKNQFQMMTAGGVDVALAVYRGDKGSRKAYALKGLDAMAQGLKEMRNSGENPFTRPREYPLIGMALDLQGLAEQYGGPVDLKVGDVQRSLYGMVKDFYQRIPEEFRATVQLPASRLGAAEAAGAQGQSSPGAAYIVRLIGDEAVKDADNTVLAAVGNRFYKEFGARLVWAGTPLLRAKIPTLDAIAPFPAATRPALVNRDGWIHTASFGPGYDASDPGKNTVIRPRENGQQTIEDFKTILAASPDWVFVDSWNGYAQGTDIAPTLEYGLLYRDLLRAAVLQYKQSADYAAHFLKANAPRVVQAGQIYQVEVAVQNSGTSDWDVFNVASLSYRWVKDGKYVGDPGPNNAGLGQVRGEIKHFLIGVAAPIQEGQALPAGQYELELNMTRRVGAENVWFDQAETAPFRIPVTVGNAPAGRPTWVNSTLPTVAQAGATYPVAVRVRNDGSDTWRKGGLSLGYRWRKVSTYLKGAGEDADTVVAEGKRVPLEADVNPGRLIEVEVPVATADASGKPLPLWTPDSDWSYVLEWDLHDGQKWLGAAGAATCREVVEIVERDPAPSFIGCNLSNDLVAGKTEKITVGLTNGGPNGWQKGRDKVIVHWFYMDGTEASWNDAELPLQEDVPAFSRHAVQVPENSAARLFGDEEKDSKKKKDKKDKKDDKREERDAKGRKLRTEYLVQPTVLREVPVKVPYYFGPMYCVLDFQYDGKNASTGLASKGNDLLVIPVNVFSPTFTPLPIAGFFNVDGVSQDVDRGDANIDGRGNSLPAEFLPPYVPRPSVGGDGAPSLLYPSGLWVNPLNDLNASRVCFLYPSKNNQTPNMVQCDGQRIPVGTLYRTAVHFLAVCTEEDAAGEFTLYYSDGTSEKKKLTFTHWNDAPKHGERSAFIVPHRHTAAGDDPQTRCYVNHYTLPTNRLKQLSGIELPRLPAVKIMAVTLESATLRAN